MAHNEEEAKYQSTVFRMKLLTSVPYWTELLETSRENKWDDIRLAKEIIKGINEVSELSYSTYD